MKTFDIISISYWFKLIYCISNEHPNGFQRKLKSIQKVKETSDKLEDVKVPDNHQTDSEDGPSSSNVNSTDLSTTKSDTSSVKSQIADQQDTEILHALDLGLSSDDDQGDEKNDYLFDDDILLLTYKRNGLINIKEQLLRDKQSEKREIENLKTKLEVSSSSNGVPTAIPKQDCLQDVMILLQKENQILQIKKINLAREIIEIKELCTELSAHLKLSATDKASDALNK